MKLDLSVVEATLVTVDWPACLEAWTLRGLVAWASKARFSSKPPSRSTSLSPLWNNKMVNRHFIFKKVEFSITYFSAFLKVLVWQVKNINFNKNFRDPPKLLSLKTTNRARRKIISKRNCVKNRVVIKSRNQDIRYLAGNDVMTRVFVVFKLVWAHPHCII